MDQSAAPSGGDASGVSPSHTVPVLHKDSDQSNEPKLDNKAKPKGAKKPPPRLTRKEKQDDSIMSTNNSCIVSKRSVEKIYDGKDQGFLRFFVPQFQRRSPLINRGYWLRMKIIQRTIRRFLEAHQSQRTVVVNLGCGYDTLPFDLLTEHASLCSSTTFVDVDYPLLMTKKVKIIQQQPELHSILGDLQTPTTGSVLLSSPRYMAVACDLEKVSSLDAVLKSFNPAKTAYLFVAEVSMTYMEQKAAERVIEWSSTFPDSSFCLLEQFLPASPFTHPFTSTMLKHFTNLNSPLKSAQAFPKLDDQRGRFSKYAAWQNVQIQSMWALWCNGITTREERQSLDRIEPFDEWEEFAMFASHYFVLVATTLQSNQMEGLGLPENDPCPDAKLESQPGIGLARVDSTSLGGHARRFGAACWLSNELIGHYGGHGERERLAKADFYQLGPEESKARALADKVSTLSHPVMCHTMTAIAPGLAIMAGGRSSPIHASSTCLEVTAQGHRQIDALPFGLYRHSAVAVTLAGHPGLLVFGGRKNAVDLSDAWLLYYQGKWHNVSTVLQDQLPLEPRFGASLATEPNSSTSGVLMGGMGSDGTIMQDVWKWQLATSYQSPESPFSITLQNATADVERSDLGQICRFGASVTTMTDGYMLLGGISAAGLVPPWSEYIQVDAPIFRATRLHCRHDAQASPPPMLTGMSTVSLPDGRLLVLGGGAVCFSFGAFWNASAYVLSISTPSKPPFSSPQDSSPSIHLLTSPTHPPAPTKSTHILQIPRTTLDQTPLAALLAASNPTVLTNVPLGPCHTLWDIPYLRAHIPADLPVVVHESPHPTMDFVAKNFAYKTHPFATFLAHLEAQHHTYMRAISHTKPTTEPTSLASDWPWLAPDFHLPPALGDVHAHEHSSVLRISGPVNMWLHYDVMANLLCQIRGAKRLVLFAPAAVSQLAFAPGASSSPLDPFADGVLPPQAVERHEVLLQPGEILFIPPMWAHAAAPTDGLSIAVNVFFRHLDAAKYAAGRDVYGNRDLRGYENGRSALERIVGGFKGVSGDVKGFYLRRLADELREAAVKAEKDTGGDAGPVSE